MRHFITLVFFLSTIFAFAQTKGINYKAKLADNTGTSLANQNVTVQFSIYEGNMGANLVYQEEHTTTTDVNGIIILNIGEGANLQGDFTFINWGFDTHFLKTEVDTGSGFVEIGNTEFKTVPYALHAKTVENPGVSSSFTEATQNLISANNTVADFVVGSPNTEDQNNVNFDGRMFWDDSKAAFRAGSADDTQWNDVNRGLYSFAGGQNNIASGINTVAFGENNLVYGSSSVAFGRDNTIINSGSYSAVIGFGNYVSGAQAIAVGKSTEARGNYSFAGGNASDAFGEGSFAYGFQNIAEGKYNTVFGFQSLSKPTAENSFTSGYRLENHTLNGTVLGEWNEADTNALLNVGNGSSTTRKSAFKVLRNGDVHIDNLSGSGTKVVYADNNGNLTTESGTKYLSIPSTSFSVSDSNKGFSRNEIRVKGKNGEVSDFFAPVQLPNASVIKKMIISYYDNSITKDLSCNLVRTAIPVNSGSTVVTSANLGGNTDNYRIFDVSPIVHTVDNLNYQYHLHLKVTDGTSWDQDLTLQGVIIEYTE